MVTRAAQEERATQEIISNLGAEKLNEAIARIIFGHLWTVAGDGAVSDWEEAEQDCPLKPHWCQDALLVGNGASEDCRWARMPHSVPVQMEADSLKPGTRQFIDEYVAVPCPSCGERHDLRGFLGAHPIRCTLLDEQTGEEAEFYIYSHESVAKLRQWFARQFWSQRFVPTRARERVTKRKYARFVDCWAELHRLPLSNGQFAQLRLLLWRRYKREMERLSTLVRPLCANPSCRRPVSEDELYCANCRRGRRWSHDEASAERRRRDDRPVVDWSTEQDRFYKALERGKEYILRQPPEGRVPPSLIDLLVVCPGLTAHRTIWARYWMSPQGKKLYALKASLGPHRAGGDVCAEHSCDRKSQCRAVLEQIREVVSAMNF